MKTTFTLCGAEYEVTVPSDIELLRGPLARLASVAAAFTAAPSLLDLSRASLDVLLATRDLLRVVAPNVPWRALQAASVEELDGMMDALCTACVARHGDQIVIARLN